MFRRLKRMILNGASAAGVEIVKAYDGNGYCLERRLSFGVDPWRDMRRILPREARCIFDVGANSGQTAATVRRVFPAGHIHSFEPDPASFARLSTAMDGDPRFTAVNAAVGDQSGESLLYRNRFDATNSLLPTAAGAQEYVHDTSMMETTSTIAVPITTINQYCTERGIDSIDILKIDVQGYELRVLDGAAAMMARQLPVIYLEVSFVRYYDGQPLFQDVYEYLYSRSYRLVGLYETGFLTHYYQVGGNALFVREADGVRRPHRRLVIKSRPFSVSIQ